MKSASNKISMGIIGFGRFGRLWATCMKRFGRVKIYDKKTIGEKGFCTLDETVDCDILFLLVPISQIESVCKKIAKKLSKTTIVADCCSVKMDPVKSMVKFLPKNQPIIATHPLFGPDSAKNGKVDGHKIVVCRVRCNAVQIRKTENIFKKLKLKIIHETPFKHDLQMAKSQALVHFIGRGLEKLNLLPQRVFTPDYAALFRMNEMVKNDTWELFFDMQRKNSHAKRIRKTFLNSLNKLNNDINRD